MSSEQGLQRRLEDDAQIDEGSADLFGDAAESGAISYLALHVAQISPLIYSHRWLLSGMALFLPCVMKQETEAYAKVQPEL